MVQLIIGKCKTISYNSQEIELSIYYYVNDALYELYT